MVLTVHYIADDEARRSSSRAAKGGTQSSCRDAASPLVPALACGRPPASARLVVVDSLPHGRPPELRRQHDKTSHGTEARKQAKLYMSASVSVGLAGLLLRASFPHALLCVGFRGSRQHVVLLHVILGAGAAKQQRQAHVADAAQKKVAGSRTRFRRQRPGMVAAEVTADILDMEGAMADAGRSRRGWWPAKLLLHLRAADKSADYVLPMASGTMQGAAEKSTSAG